VKGRVGDSVWWEREGEMERERVCACVCVEMSGRIIEGVCETECVEYA
jgi:hypothetical protein